MAKQSFVSYFRQVLNPPSKQGLNLVVTQIKHCISQEQGFSTWGTFAYLKGYIYCTAATN